MTTSTSPSFRAGCRITLLAAFAGCGNADLPPDQGLADQGVVDALLAGRDAAAGPTDLTRPVTDAAPGTIDLRTVDLGPCGGGCGDGGRCELDAGRCVECLVDGDCPADRWCRSDGQGGGSCAPGCRSDFDCRGGDGGGMTMACCDHGCIDTATTIAHCGGCGMGCGAGQDVACCASLCVRTGSDITACGGCGNACRFANAAATCANGKCQMGVCNAGFADCNAIPGDGCETSVASDLGNCGGCGKACTTPHATPACIGGACGIAACDPGFRNCNGLPADGCEINSGADLKNCGACGNDCGQLPHAVATCLGGACVVGQCAPGFGNCNKIDGDGCEHLLDADVANCGACGKVCPAPANVITTCAMSACGLGGCRMGFADCDNNPGNGCEANLATDPANCSACGKPCPQNSACVSGKCSSLFGSGKAGNLTVNVNTVFGGYAETHLSVSAVAKVTSLTVVDPAGFAAGDKVLILNVRSPIGNDGVWEIADLTSLNGNTLQLATGLIGSYPEPANTIVRTLPQHADVTIANGASLSARPWTPNTLSGGIVAFLASGAVTVDGKLTANGAGYLGGVGNANDPNNFIWKAQGESYLGLGLTDLPNNVGNGGGGAGGSKRGGCAGAGGGGGGYGGAGMRGGDNNYACGAIQVGGVGGASYGDAQLGRIYFGSGGGSGGYTTDPLLGAGGAGGGIVIVLAPKITVNGAIEARGADGVIEFKIYGGGGGGAGGSIYLRTQVAVNDPGKVVVPGGTGGGVTMGGTQVGGAGGAGRVYLDARP